MELKDVEAQIQKLEAEKLAIPVQIEDLRKKREALGRKKAEYLSQKEKLEAALAERQIKYASEINRLKEELQLLAVPLQKAKDDLAKS